MVGVGRFSDAMARRRERRGSCKAGSVDILDMVRKGNSAAALRFRRSCAE